MESARQMSNRMQRCSIGGQSDTSEHLSSHADAACPESSESPTGYGNGSLRRLHQSGTLPANNRPGTLFARTTTADCNAASTTVDGYPRGS